MPRHARALERRNRVLVLRSRSRHEMEGQKRSIAHKRRRKMKPIIDRDEKGHVTHKRLSNGDERWYDAAGHITHVRFGDGNERWYDADWNTTHERRSNGDERWYDYDADGNLAQIRRASGRERGYVSVV